MAYLGGVGTMRFIAEFSENQVANWFSGRGINT